MQISNFMKIRPVGAELLHADGQTDRHGEANSRFFAVLRTHLKSWNKSDFGWGLFEHTITVVRISK